ncbi:striatin-interacting protein 1-like isoform X5 [Mustelus asterias]
MEAASGSSASRARELSRNQRRDSEGSLDFPNLEFEYGDSDSIVAELSELYSYTEEPEFAANRDCFEEDFAIHGKGKKWVELEENEHKSYLMRLLDGLEVISRERRLKFARAILYLAQGVFDDCYTETEVVHWARYNVFLLYEMGTFGALVELLNMEIDNSQACSSSLRKPAISLADSTELRVLLNIMYLMVEIIRREGEDDKPEWSSARDGFRTELSSLVYNGEPFAVLLFSFVNKYCNGHTPHCPIKKVLLLLWKTILFCFGGFETVQELKMEKRAKLGLPPLLENSIQVTRTLRATSPPASAMDILEQQQKRGRRGRRVLVKQDSLDIYCERDEAREEEDEADDGDSGIEGEVDPLEREALIQDLHSPGLAPERWLFPRCLPWATKVREKDIEEFLEVSRCKFIGFTLGNDTETLVGLPRPIHNSVKTLKQHKYVSIAEVQAKMEEELQKSPVSLGAEEVEQTSVEILYQAMLYNLPQYMIALLKIQLAAAPTSKAKTDSINILADLLPEEMPIFVLDYPHCVIHELPELTTEVLEAGDHTQFCWRNLFSCINLLRILNKLTKWKHSRIMMLVVFKSAPILKRVLRAKQAMLQLYALKLLKFQTKYLGRQWRKSNMKIMSAIYHKVRHRLNDDWAYGNDIDARPWDFQAEECSLRVNIEMFNSRRYGLHHTDLEFAPVDNCLQSVLGHQVSLPEDFRYSYELWLEREVFAHPIHWEDLLQPLT